jgi:hypothetical protein
VPEPFGEIATSPDFFGQFSKLGQPNPKTRQAGGFESELFPMVDAAVILVRGQQLEYIRQFH